MDIKLQKKFDKKIWESWEKKWTKEILKKNSATLKKWKILKENFEQNNLKI